MRDRSCACFSVPAALTLSGRKHLPPKSLSCAGHFIMTTRGDELLEFRELDAIIQDFKARLSRPASSDSRRHLLRDMQGMVPELVEGPNGWYFSAWLPFLLAQAGTPDCIEFSQRLVQMKAIIDEVSAAKCRFACVMLTSQLQVEPYCHPAPEYHQQWHVLIAEIAAWSPPENYPSSWTPVSSPSTPLFFSRPMTDEELAAEFGDPAADEEPTIASQTLSLLSSTSAQSTDAVSSEHPSPRIPQDE